MVLEDSKGNLFNVELCLEVERDPDELLLLAQALYEKLKSVEKDDIYTKYTEIIEHATRGRMSKAYLDTSVVKSVIDDNINHIVECEVEEQLKYNKEK